MNIKNIKLYIKNNKIEFVILLLLLFCLLYILLDIINFKSSDGKIYKDNIWDNRELFVNIVIPSSILLFIILLIVTFFIHFKRMKHQIVLLIIVLVIIFGLIGHIYYTGWGEFFGEFNIKEKPFYLVNIAIALVALLTATFTWWKNNINQRISFSREGTRQDNLFIQAIGLIKEDNDLITRKGGVHVLKELGKTSPEQAHKCIDILCSLNESWMPTILKINPIFFKENSDFINIKDFKNIRVKKSNAKNENDKLNNQMYLSQLVLQSLSEIFKHISENNNFKGPFNLSNKYLCAINLKNKFNLCNANLQSANLQSADINGVDFKRVDLLCADFRNAKNIDKAIFDENKKDAIFTNEDYYKHYPKK